MFGFSCFDQKSQSIFYFRQSHPTLRMTLMLWGGKRGVGRGDWPDILSFHLTKKKRHPKKF